MSVVLDAELDRSELLQQLAEEVLAAFESIASAARARLGETPRGPRLDAFASINQATAEKVVKAGQQPAFNFVPPGLGGYAPAVSLTEDASLARQLLAEAGFPGGRGFPRLELSTWPVSTPQLEAIQEQWRKEEQKHQPDTLI